jgi:hypothetical protein
MRRAARAVVDDAREIRHGGSVHQIGAAINGDDNRRGVDADLLDELDDASAI